MENSAVDPAVDHSSFEGVDKSVQPVKPVELKQGGGSSYPFKVISPPIVLDDGVVSGQVLYSFPLDCFADATSSAISLGYEKYTFEQVDFELGNTAPLGSASGSAYAGAVIDPSNVLSNVAATYALNKKALVRQINSVQVRARDKITLNLKGSIFTDQKFCKRAGYARMESFGNFYVIAYSIPTTGDSAVFPVVVTGTIKFFNMTFNMPAIVTLLRAATIDITPIQAKVKRVGNVKLLSIPYKKTNVLHSDSGVVAIKPPLLLSATQGSKVIPLSYGKAIIADAKINVPLPPEVLSGDWLFANDPTSDKVNVVFDSKHGV